MCTTPLEGGYDDSVTPLRLAFRAVQPVWVGKRKAVDRDSLALHPFAIAKANNDIDTDIGQQPKTVSSDFPEIEMWVPNTFRSVWKPTSGFLFVERRRVTWQL